MTLKDKITIGFFAIAVALMTAFISVHFERKHAKAWENAQRYARENHTKCYSSKYSTVFVFDNWSLIGVDVMCDLYD